MSNYAEQYADRVQRVLELKRAQEDRKAAIRTEVGDTTPSMGASLEHVLHGRYATDALLKELQVMIDRATQEAIMFGVGAMIKNLAFLANRA